MGSGGGGDGGADALEDVRRELEDIGERLDALRARVEEVAPGATLRRGRFGVDNSLGSSQSLRVLAMRMAVTGVSRRVAERRLRGTVAPEELQLILDEAYGRRAVR